jgi:hypothetical protein
MSPSAVLRRLRSVALDMHKQTSTARLALTSTRQWHGVQRQRSVCSASCLCGALTTNDVRHHLLPARTSSVTRSISSALFCRGRSSISRSDQSRSFGTTAAGGPAAVDRVLASDLTMDQFASCYLNTGVPVVVVGLANHWKAMEFHHREASSSGDKDSRDREAVVQFLQHAASLCANTMANVEVGQAYTSAERVAVNVGDFLEVLSRDCSATSALHARIPTVYLAQQQLFDFSPQLRELIETPP